eukprot:m.14078 g.14078  ORF g.14078 m.14078 type:complete len:79 (-) comp3116_c0_seq1:44-280(-)
MKKAKSTASTARQRKDVWLNTVTQTRSCRTHSPTVGRTGHARDEATIAVCIQSEPSYDCLNLRDRTEHPYGSHSTYNT